MEGQKVAAFFDFDRTLVEVESGRIGMKWLREHGMLPRGFLMRVLVASYLHKMRFISDERMVRIMLIFYRGRRLVDFQRGSEEFYAGYLKPHLAPNILAKLNFHREEGHLLVLISGSLRYLLEPVVKDLGFHVLFCTDLEEGGDGLLTGRSKGPICVGENKKLLTLKLAEQEGLDLAKSYAYGNDMVDLHLLELVGNPYVVEPNAPLEDVAHQRSWPVLTYR